MTTYTIHFIGAIYTEEIKAPNAETAMDRAMNKLERDLSLLL